MSCKVLPQYAQVYTLRGEIGASCMEGRIRGSQVKYIRYILENENQNLLKVILRERQETLRDYWMQSSLELMKDIEMEFIQLREPKGKKLEVKIRNWDETEWREKLDEKRA